MCTTDVSMVMNLEVIRYKTVIWQLANGKDHLQHVKNVSSVCALDAINNTIHYNILLKVIDCGHPGNIINGDVTAYDGTHEGTFARYWCNYGYSLKGAAYRRCGSDGRWGGTEPTCEGEIISKTMHCSFKAHQRNLQKLCGSKILCYMVLYQRL